MNTIQSPPENKSTIETVTETAFFQDVPPGQVKLVTGLVTKEQKGGNNYHAWHPVAIRLYCTSEQCDGYRSFDANQDNYYIKSDGEYSQFITYTCRNCQKSSKRYAISIERVVDVGFTCYKFGEVPQFGPPNPSKLMNLMGSERDAYLKGRRCENQGLGIAAFAYYRRVVENQKAKVIGEMLKVGQKLNADPVLIEELKAAKEETRFSEAINRIKHGLPQVLLINGHNPLTLLHSALSEGLHATSDEECLELATSIRVVLTELVERMAIAVKEEGELTSAVHRLLKAGGKRQ